MAKTKVLIIDKESPLLIAAGRVLEQQYDVTMALSADGGIDALGEQTFSLVICELTLEGAAGLTVLDAVRKNAPGTAFILQTDYTAPSFKSEAFKLGADDYLFKPYTPEELLFRARRSIETADLKQRIGDKKTLLSNCCVCKKIMCDDNGAAAMGWMEVEDFLKERMGVLLSSTYCPKCAQTVQEDLMAQLERLKASKPGCYPQ